MFQIELEICNGQVEGEMREDTYIIFNGPLIQRL